MQFRQNTSVYTASGETIGHIDRVVMDPKTLEVTNLIVRKGTLFTEDRVVPVSQISQANEERVTLEQDAEDLANLPLFEEKQYIPLAACRREAARAGNRLVLCRVRRYEE